MFSLRAPIEQVLACSVSYPVPEAEVLIIEEIAPRVMDRGWLTRDEFLYIGMWKSPRPKKHYERNEAAYVRAVTEVALGTADERLSIEILTLLDGVNWPTASVILHFLRPEPYPILDFRALWTLGVSPPPPYDFGFWHAYVQVCRNLAAEAGVSLRTLDRALWRYSDLHQSELERAVMAGVE